MTPKQIETINNALRMYGAHVGQDNRITKGDLPTRIEVSVIRNRLQFIGINEDGTRGHTQASGSVSAATVSDFVESFWYGKKQHQLITGASKGAPLNWRNNMQSNNAREARVFGLNRGRVTPVASLLWRNAGMGELSVVELRLLSFLDYVFKNDGLIKPERTSREEQMQIIEWEGRGYLHISNDGCYIRPTASFYRLVQDILFQAYVAHVEYEDPMTLMLRDCIIHERQIGHAAGNNQMSMLHKPTQIQLTQMFASGTRHHHQEALKVEMANKLKEINYWQTNYGG